jgi:hypothetical protein
VRPCSRQPPRGDQDLGRGQDAHHDSMDTRDARWPPRRPGRPSGRRGSPPNSGPLRRALRTPLFVAVGSVTAADWLSARKCHVSRLWCRS